MQETSCLDLQSLILEENRLNNTLNQPKWSKIKWSTHPISFGLHPNILVQGQKKAVQLETSFQAFSPPFTSSLAKNSSEGERTRTEACDLGVVNLKSKNQAIISNKEQKQSIKTKMPIKDRPKKQEPPTLSRTEHHATTKLNQTPRKQGRKTQQRNR